MKMTISSKTVERNCTRRREVNLVPVIVDGNNILIVILIVIVNSRCQSNFSRQFLKPVLIHRHMRNHCRQVGHDAVRGEPTAKLLVQLLRFDQDLLQHRQQWKKRSERRKHCTLAAKNFRPAADPFAGVQDGRNLISWRWSLPLPTNPLRWGSMHAISRYRGNRPTNKRTHKHTNRTDYNTLHHS